jgi:hypothetical protein
MRQWSAGLESERLSGTPHVSWTSRIEAIVLGRQDRASRVEPLAQGALRGPWLRLSVEFTEGFPAHRPLRGGPMYVKNESHAPLLQIEIFAAAGLMPVRPPAVSLPAPKLDLEGAHEKNARECNSGRRVARRSG